MTRSLIFPVLFVLAAGGLRGQQTRVAAVRVSDAFQACASAKQALGDIEKRRKALADDPRNKELDAMVAEIRKLQEAASSNKDPQARDKAFRDIEIKRDQLESIGRVVEEDRVKAERELNRDLVRCSREALDQIRQAAAEIGRERGFDLVIDSAGNSNTGVPVILYSKQLPDLTKDVIARLNQAPASPEGAAKPAPPAVTPAGEPGKPALEKPVTPGKPPGTGKPPVPLPATPGKEG